MRLVFISHPSRRAGETVHADIGLLGLTNKHIYFAGSRKKFRVRHDSIVSFDPYDDGLGIMRDAQTARPQTFRTGDGWFVYNLPDEPYPQLEATPPSKPTKIALHHPGSFTH